LLDRVYEFENRWKTCEAKQLASQQEPPKKDIPKNFEKIGSRYFYIEEFYQKNWWAAAKTCRQMGGVLARIQDDKELTAIKRHSKRKHMEHYWLDINDFAEEDRFVYSISDEITPYLKWASTEPNNLNNNEHCVDLYAEHMYDNKCEKNTTISVRQIRIN